MPSYFLCFALLCGTTNTISNYCTFSHKSHIIVNETLGSIVSNIHVLTGIYCAWLHLSPSLSITQED